MASDPVTEFCIMKLQPDATVERAGTDAYATWQELVAHLKSTPGVKRVFFGRSIESPDTAVGVTLWDSFASWQAYAAQPDMVAEVRAKFMSLVTNATVHHVFFSPDPLPTLQAPCTELATGYGAEPGYLDSVRKFADKMAAGAGHMPGYVSICSGETVQDDVAREPGAADGIGKAVVLAVGWASRDAHMALKGRPGVIDENIHLLRTGRKGMGMYHVQFKEA